MAEESATERPLDGEVMFPDIDFAAHAMPDMHEKMAELRERGRFAAVMRHGRKALLVTRYADVDFAFGDEVDLPLAHGAKSFAEPAQGRSLFSMTGQEHRKHRALVASAFTPAALASYEQEFMIPEARERLAGLDLAGKPIDLVSGFTEDFGIAVIVRILGLPITDTSRFKRWAHDLVSSSWAFERAMQASREFEAYVTPIIQERRQKPQADLISRLASAEVDGERLRDIDIVSFLRVLFPAGADTTYRQLGNFLLHMLRVPELRRQLLADRKSVEPAIEEMLRWEPAIGNYPRIAPRDMMWRGAFVPADTVLLLGVTSANRDPRLYDQPDKFVLARQAKKITTFGGGVHFCIGAVLARREMACAINALLDLHPEVALAGAAPAVEGPVLRGPPHLHVTFRAAANA